MDGGLCQQGNGSLLSKELRVEERELRFRGCAADFFLVLSFLFVKDFVFPPPRKISPLFYALADLSFVSAK